MASEVHDEIRKMREFVSSRKTEKRSMSTALFGILIWARMHLLGSKL